MGWYSVQLQASQAAEAARRWCPGAVRLQGSSALPTSPTPSAPAPAPVDGRRIDDAFVDPPPDLPSPRVSREHGEVPGFVLMCAALAARARSAQLACDEDPLLGTHQLVGIEGNGVQRDLPFDADTLAGHLITFRLLDIEALVDIARTGEFVTSDAHVASLVLDCARAPLVAAALALLGPGAVPPLVIDQLDRKAVLHGPLLSLIRHASDLQARCPSVAAPPTPTVRAALGWDPPRCAATWREIVAHLLLFLVARATWWMHLAEDFHVRFGYDRTELPLRPAAGSAATPTTVPPTDRAPPAPGQAGATAASAGGAGTRLPRAPGVALRARVCLNCTARAVFKKTLARAVHVRICSKPHVRGRPEA